MLDIVVEVIPKLPEVIIIWITIFFLFLLLSKFLYEPMNKFINSRQEKIMSNLNEAKTLNEDAAKLKLEYESRIAEAKEESQKILAEARARGEELRNGILAEAKAEAETLKTRAGKDIEREKAAAFDSIKAETGNMAVLIASKIMEREMNLENQEDLVDKFIDEVGNTPWQN